MKSNLSAIFTLCILINAELKFKCKCACIKLNQFYEFLLPSGLNVKAGAQNQYGEYLYLDPMCLIIWNMVQIYRSHHGKTLLNPYVHSKGPDQSFDLSSLIRNFTIESLSSLESTDKRKIPDQIVQMCR